MPTVKRKYKHFGFSAEIRKDEDGYSVVTG
jgi:hypothetical protein